MGSLNSLGQQVEDHDKAVPCHALSSSIFEFFGSITTLIWLMMMLCFNLLRPYYDNGFASKTREHGSREQAGLGSDGFQIIYAQQLLCREEQCRRKLD